MNYNSRILLIEDDKISNYINRNALSKYVPKDKIEIVNNGDLALEYINNKLEENNQCPDIMFLDIHMPSKNGFDFLEEFNNISFPNKERITIIGLTTSTHPRDVEKLISMGCKRVLQKPLLDEHLVSIFTEYNKVNENCLS
jgi:CheY-like chemotaxis protein